MKDLAIYMEGGGDTAEGKTRLRKGMAQFLRVLCDQARMRRHSVRVVPCGTRNEAFKRFRHAHATDTSTMSFLLIDSEEPVAAAVKGHLSRGDGWDLGGCTDDSLHLMVQVMETWLLADPQALSSYYEQRFQANALPATANIETVPKDAVLDALKRATKDTKKGEYHKIKHASDLLARIDPQKAQDRCSHCRRLFDRLASVLQEA